MADHTERPRWDDAWRQYGGTVQRDPIDPSLSSYALRWEAYLSDNLDTVWPSNRPPPTIHRPQDTAQTVAMVSLDGSMTQTYVVGAPRVPKRKKKKSTALK